MKTILLCRSAAPLLLLSACTEIPVVGLAQDGTRVCPEGKTAYVFQNARIASCMTTAVVEFTHCVSELGLAEASSKSSSEEKVSLDALRNLLGANGVTLNKKSEMALKRSFANGGLLEVARAHALDQCTRLLDVIKQ